MQPILRVRIALYLQEQRNFIKAGTVGFGVPFAIAGLWMFGQYGGFDLWLFIVALTIPVSWLWAFCMWHVYKTSVPRIQPNGRAQRTNDDPRA